MKGAHGRDVFDEDLDGPRCTADAKSRLREGAEPGTPAARCGKRAVAGAAVCGTHGGAAPQVKRSARQRLAAMVDPALEALADIVEGRVWDATPADRLRATKMILDRTGYPARTEVSLLDGVEEIESILDDLGA